MTLQKPIPIITDMINYLKADSELAAFITANFSNSMSYFVGIDDMYQPVTSDIPFMAFRIGAMTPNADRASRTITIQMALVVSDQDATTSSPVTTLDGLTLIQDLYYQVERVLENLFATVLDYNKTPEYETGLLEIARPLFRYSWAINFQADIE